MGTDVPSVGSEVRPDGGRLPGAAAGVGVAAIWLATLAAAVWSPALISGSQQEHLPIAAISGWVWAAVASGYVLMARSAARRRSRSEAIGFVVSIVAVWGVTALASILAPSFVTGSDPTQIPLVAIIAPLAAMAVTGFICLHTALSEKR